MECRRLIRSRIAAKLLLTATCLAISITSSGCTRQADPPAGELPHLPEELVFHDWEDDIPQSVFDAFTEETGISVRYVAYEAQEDAVEDIISGKVYDLVVLENDLIPLLLEGGHLAEIDFGNVPNFINISPNFRDLAYDPGNLHSVPFNWGTTGLVVRRDLLAEMPSHWSDLWNPAYAGRVAIRQDVPGDLFGATLKTLGYSINSEDPEEMQAALERMLEMRDDVLLVGSTDQEAVPLLLSGEAVILLGWAEDVYGGQEENEFIDYVLPAEGTMLWGDNFVIPANSPNKAATELLLNFLLRAEVGAQISNHNYYASANEAARLYIDPELLDDPVAYPPAEDLVCAEVFLPRSAEGEARLQEMWAQFLAAGDQ